VSAPKAPWKPNLRAEGDKAEERRPTMQEAAARAEKVTRRQEEQGFFVSKEKLTSRVVTDEATCKTKNIPDKDQPQIKPRTAQSRWPDSSDAEVFLFGDDPRNLGAAQGMRDVDVGYPELTEEETATFSKVATLLEAHLFTEKNIKAAYKGFESWEKSLPKKFSAKKKQSVIQSVLLENNAKDKEGNYVQSYSQFVEAFVKAEVSDKPKPRSIANHKEIRCGALAKVAWVFETILFDKLALMSIKHENKKDVITKIIGRMDKGFDKNGGQWLENDLSAFEFGIGKVLKRMEQNVLRRIARVIGVDDEGFIFQRVVNDRDKSAVWTMLYTDSAGQKVKAQFKLPRPMRESGDRLTSSGNFYQNVVAWLSFLCVDDFDAIEKTIKDLIDKKGGVLFYHSARDGKKYKAILAFEGDDTLGRLEEALQEGFEAAAIAYFKRYGWKPKFKFRKLEGFDVVTFVGYDTLLNNGRAVYDNDELVMCPEIHRMMTTKQWTTTAVTEEQLKACTQVYAQTMASGFQRVEAMWWFCKNLYKSNQPKGEVKITDEQVREYYLTTFGELPEDGTAYKRLKSAEFPPLIGCGCRNTVWRQLARLSGGEHTDDEWASMCTEMDLNVHGLDLACHMARSWVGAAPPRA